jgi:putative hydrolase of the HAD superfamily
MNVVSSTDPFVADRTLRRTRFADVVDWVFDLDNTLYPPSTDLFAQVNERIRRYVADHLGVSLDEARRVQRDYYQRYGTTLRGLMIERGLKPDGFLDYVHDIDHSVVAPDPALAAALARLPGRRFVMTNGTRRHAEKVMARVGIGDLFDDVFDIVDAGLLPKPQRPTYERFFARDHVDPARAAMFEDLARNLEVPHAEGMATVLVAAPADRPDRREAWEGEGVDAPWVDWVTHDLAGFLREVRPA